MRIYTFLFQQHIEETIIEPKDGDNNNTTTTEYHMVWKIMDYQFGEMIPYL